MRNALTMVVLGTVLLVVMLGVVVAQTHCPNIPGAEHVCQQWQQQEQQWLQQDVLRELQLRNLMQDTLRHQRRYERRQQENWNRAYRMYRMERGDNPWDVWNDYYQQQTDIYRYRDGK